jgi:hypothetical protein
MKMVTILKNLESTHIFMTFYKSFITFIKSYKIATRSCQSKWEHKEQHEDVLVHIVPLGNDLTLL